MGSESQPGVVGYFFSDFSLFGVLCLSPRCSGSLPYLLVLYFLEQGCAKLFWKEPASKYFRLHGPWGLYYSMECCSEKTATDSTQMNGHGQMGHRSTPASLCSLAHSINPLLLVNSSLYEVLTVQITGVVTSDRTLIDIPHWNFRRGLGSWLGPAESVCSGSYNSGQC